MSRRASGPDAFPGRGGRHESPVPGPQRSRLAPRLAAALGQAFAAGRLPDQSPLPAWLGPFFHVLRSFLDHHGLLLAAALSYTTVLSIVPFLAVAFSVAKGLGFYHMPQVRDVLLRLTAGRTEIVDQILRYIHQTNVKTLGTLGTIVLLATAVFLVSTIEGAINAAWNIRVRRSMITRFTSYLVLIVICPPLLFTAVSTMASVQGLDLTRRLLEFSLIQEIGHVLLAMAPVIIVWLAFYLLYQFLPNTKVKAKNALMAALIAGSLWQLVQWAYIKFQFGAIGYNAIYGSFAQIPLLLLWLYISWIIVLFGAQISHTAQCYGDFLRQSRAGGLTQSHRHALALYLTLLAARAACQRRLPPNVAALARQFGLPEASLAEMWEDLAASGLVVEAATQNGRTFAPLARPEAVTVADVTRALNGGGRLPPPGLLRALPILDPLLAVAEAPDREETLAALLARFGQDLDEVLSKSM